MLFGRRNVSAGLFVSNRSYVYLALEGEGGSAKVSASSAGTLPESVVNSMVTFLPVFSSSWASSLIRLSFNPSETGIPGF